MLLAASCGKGAPIKRAIGRDVTAPGTSVKHRTGHGYCSDYRWSGFSCTTKREAYPAQIIGPSSLSRVRRMRLRGSDATSRGKLPRQTGRVSAISLVPGRSNTTTPGRHSQVKAPVRRRSARDRGMESFSEPDESPCHPMRVGVEGWTASY